MEKQTMKAQQDELWQRLYAEVLRPHFDSLTKIWTTNGNQQPAGGIACAVFELLDRGNGPHGLGWDGSSPVFRLTPKKTLQCAKTLELLYPADPAAQWLRTDRYGRILLFIHSGVLCLNFTPAEGLSIAKGTLDKEWKS